MPLAGSAPDRSFVTPSSARANWRHDGHSPENATEQRARAERYLRVHFGVTRVLAEAANLSDAAPRIIEALCESSNSLLGSVWLADEESGRLRCLGVWHGGASTALDEFAAVTRRMLFERGLGLPGRVWSSGQPAWIVDVTADPNFPRVSFALQAGLHAAFAFPIRVRDRTIGVVECFCDTLKPPDEPLMQLVQALGEQIGQFTERREVEETRAKLAAIVDSSDDAIIGETLDGLITSWNRGAERIFGYSAAEAIGQHISLIVPGHRSGEEETVLGRLRRGERLDHFDTERRAKDGRIVNVSLTISPIHDAEGHIIGASKVARDVTERLRTERALRESEERYRRLVSLMPAAVYTCAAPSGAITFYNDRAQDLWGRAPVIGDTDARFCGSFKLWWPDGRPLRHEDTPMAVALREGRSFRNEEVVIERPDGSRITILVNIDPERDADGRVVGAINVFNDTTALKQAQHELRRSEEHLRAVVETTPGCIKIVAADGTLLHMNAGGLALVEAESPDEVLGKSVLELIADDDRDAFKAFHDRICRGSKGTLDYDIIGLHGTRRRVETYAAALPGPDGGLRHLAITHDITHRKRAEAALRRHAQRVRLLWEAASVLLTGDEPDAMLKGVFAKISPSLGLHAYFNYMVVDGGDALRLVSSAGIPENVARTISRLEFGQSVCGTVALKRRPIAATGIQESEEPMVQLVKGLGIRAYACSPLLAGSRLLGTLSFASTTREQFEQDEIEFLETISHYVAAAYERLWLIERLREQDQRKDEFLATLAHELRNPLAPIRTGMQLIRRAGDNPAVLEKACPMMERQLHQMVRLVDDLLDVSRVSRNKLELRKEWVELGSIVQNAMETSRPLIEAAGHEVSVSIPPEPIVLDGDSVRLAQAFSNLLNNAAKYTNPGGRIWLTAELAAEAPGRPAEVIVRIRDSGVGIPAEKLPHIFEMFVQADTSLERTHGGLGIGLTLAQRLVEMHGGTLSASSDGPGQGSEFGVRLPVVVMPTQTPAEDGTRAAVTATDRTRRRILVVDDNRDSAEMLATMLGFLGHDVSCAHDGLEAIEKVQAFEPDVAFLDLGMPRVNGYDAARRIRAGRGGRGVMLVAVTGWGQDDDKRRSQEAGFDAHLVKPVDFSAIERLLSSLTDDRDTAPRR